MTKMSWEKGHSFFYFTFSLHEKHLTFPFSWGTIKTYISLKSHFNAIDEVSFHSYLTKFTEKSQNNQSLNFNAIHVVSQLTPHLHNSFPSLLEPLNHHISIKYLNHPGGKTELLIFIYLYFLIVRG